MRELLLSFLAVECIVPGFPMLDCSSLNHNEDVLIPPAHGLLNFLHTMQRTIVTATIILLPSPLYMLSRAVDRLHYYFYAIYQGKKLVDQLYKI